jgi:hypothetical protein
MKTQYLFNRTKIIAGIILFSACNFSCKKFVEIAPPINEIVTSTVFGSDQTANAAMVGIYSQLQETENWLNAGMSINGGLSSDELISVYQQPQDMGFFNNALLATDSQCWSYWDIAYNEIYQANAIIEGVSNSAAISTAVKSQLTGESKVVRAMNYFYLTNLYGDVPLALTTNYQVNAVLARTPSAQVYVQIKNDLIDAQMLLPVSADNTRPNKLVATALLARMYLYEKNWANAEAAATTVINSGQYGMVKNLNNVFLNTSTETIWQIAPLSQTGFNTLEGYNFLDNGGYILYQLTPALLNAFESGDQRFNSWTGNFGGAYFPSKYKVYFSYTVTEDNILLRLAEQYLIRAEARAEQGTNISGAQADLNVIRNRAGLPNTDATTPASLLNAIQHERQVEFFAEFGQRWLDLKRTGQAITVLSANKGSKVSQNALLFPIPAYELIHDVYLTQNPGY